MWWSEYVTWAFVHWRLFADTHIHSLVIWRFMVFEKFLWSSKLRGIGIYTWLIQASCNAGTQRFSSLEALFVFFLGINKLDFPLTVVPRAFQIRQVDALLGNAAFLLSPKSISSIFRISSLHVYVHTLFCNEQLVACTTCCSFCMPLGSRFSFALSVNQKTDVHGSQLIAWINWQMFC